MIDLRSANAIIENMLYVSPRRKLLYVTDVNRFSLAPVGDFQHLSCFIAGVFALGAAMIPNVDPRHAWVAEGLAHTCWITYADSVTGLAPEVVIFKGDNVGRKWVDELRDWENHGKAGTPPGVRDASPVTLGQDTEYELSDKQWLLRPEVYCISLLGCCIILIFSACRPLRVSIFFGERQVIRSGANADGLSSKR